MPDDLTRLQKIMRLAYEMQSEDERALATAILKQRTAAWRAQIDELARTLGVRKRANAPTGADLQLLRDLSERDAASIRNTYNRDLEREISRLFNANPRGNRNYYARGLEQWSSQRAAWKDRQVALYSQKTAAYEARQQFVALNGMRSAKYRYTGPAPICDDCAALFAKGIVEQSVVDQYGDSQHPNCPHMWRITEAARPDVPLAELWMG